MINTKIRNIAPIQNEEGQLVWLVEFEPLMLDSDEFLEAARMLMSQPKETQATPVPPAPQPPLPPLPPLPELPEQPKKKGIWAK